MRQLKGILFDISIYINTEYRIKEFGHLTESIVDDLFSIPVRLSADAGYIRTWSGRFDGLQTQYDLRPVQGDEAPQSINGVFRAIYDASVLTHTSGNGLYDEIPIEYFESLGWQPIPDVEAVYCYRSKVSKKADIDFPILQSYLDTCLKGYLEYGEEFAIEFLETTTGWPEYWINDREVARRPWIFESKYKLLDNLLAKYPIAGNTFSSRKLEVEYTKNFYRQRQEPAEPNDTSNIQPSRTYSRKVSNLQTNFIFGFGSLINSLSRFQTNASSKDAIPVRLSSEFGYVRDWNFRGPSSMLTALGVAKSSGGDEKSTVNGIVYPVDGSDMESWDEREEGYTRIEVPWEVVAPIAWIKLPDVANSQLWMYVPEEPTPASIDYPILQTYIDVCLIGCLEYGEEYANEFLETTIGWGEFWINDRVLARRPWIHCPNYAVIDRLLEQNPWSRIAFAHRKLPVEYAALFVDRRDNS